MLDETRCTKNSFREAFRRLTFMNVNVNLLIIKM